MTWEGEPFFFSPCFSLLLLTSNQLIKADSEFVHILHFVDVVQSLMNE